MGKILFLQQNITIYNDLLFNWIPSLIGFKIELYLTKITFINLGSSFFLNFLGMKTCLKITRIGLMAFPWLISCYTIMCSWTNYIWIVVWVVFFDRLKFNPWALNIFCTLLTMVSISYFVSCMFVTIAIFVILRIIPWWTWPKHSCHICKLLLFVEMPKNAY